VEHLAIFILQKLWKNKKKTKLSPKKPTKLQIETDDLNRGFEYLEFGSEGEFDHKHPNIPNCLSITRSKYLQDKPQNPNNLPFLTTRLNDQITQKKRMPSPLTSPHFSSQTADPSIPKRKAKKSTPISHLPSQKRSPSSPPPTTTLSQNKQPKKD
jgi:hypothetical protein